MNKKRAPENIGLNQIKKPTEDIHWFSSLVQGDRDKVVYRAGSAFTTTPQTIYFMTEGVFRLYRDGGEILIYTVESPAILGIVELFYSTKERLSVQCETDCEFVLMDADVFHQMVERTRSWESIARMLAGYIIALLESHRRVIQKGTYQVMRELIVEYANLSKEARSGMLLYTYIIKRSGLSRSSVMNVLSVLNRKGYVRIKRGQLEEIVVLPDKM